MPCIVDSVMPSRLETPGDTNHDIGRIELESRFTKQLNWQKHWNGSQRPKLHLERPEEKIDRRLT